MDYLADLASRIRSAVDSGVTVDQIAQECGVSRVYVSYLLHGRRKIRSMETASRIATYCESLTKE